MLKTDKKVGDLCIVCNETKNFGIHLYTSFICVDCEREMIRTETNSPEYKYYVNRLKKINTPQIYS
ncbi:hypothetical protein JOC86_004757 [Bacillus pakistanensis]|uniref:Sigma factor G inhibitor Gin n=1 Tax=Rossellomorea pakistanensis TaxID=992288 RepID=A0ABS2NJX1_9BACI|nr:sigma factor G inhibitor Gin [Bacillus pakistanensis]MBM7588162.1 hypothetical protein [Bacillus pakistanensis]